MYLKQIDVADPTNASPVGADEVKAAIEKDGYFLWPEAASRS